MNGCERKREQTRSPFPLTALHFQRNASDRRPLLEDFTLSVCPVSQIGERDNGRLNSKNHRRFIGEIYVDAVIAGFGGEFDAFNDLAFRFGKADVPCVSFWRLVTLVFSHAARSLCGLVRAASMLDTWALLARFGSDSMFDTPNMRRTVYLDY